MEVEPGLSQQIEQAAQIATMPQPPPPDPTMIIVMALGVCFLIGSALILYIAKRRRLKKAGSSHVSK